MKSLSNYIEKDRKNIMHKYGAFYAFNSKQLGEGIEKTGLYKSEFKSLGCGLIAPKRFAEALQVDLNRAYDKAVKDRLKEYSLEEIIAYELANYEAYYTYDITDAYSACIAYGATIQDMERVFKKEYPKWSKINEY